ncbi:MAG TPA: peroxidase family protein, partial [Nocardioidaceae bacterium]|nr:peroxidase family protein [Nocardioidaceae bacterium]
YQHLVFEEFARKIQPTIDAGPLNESLYHADVNPAVTAEFAHVIYRFGHSMLTDTVARDGFGAEDLPLMNAFLNPSAFTDNGAMTPDEGAGAIAQGLMKQTGNEIDEFVVDTLRNNLLGLPLDLATINMTRARETGIPSLQAARATFYAETLNPAVKPYENWLDFQMSMKNRESLVNFIAAYGTHSSITSIDATNSADVAADKRAAAQAIVDTLETSTPAPFLTQPAELTGLNDVDFWVGGLAERTMDFGGMLGTTFNAVFEEHLENLQNADRFYYLTRNQGLNLFHQLEANSFSELIMRNTDAVNLPADAFASQDLTVSLVEPPTPLPAGLIYLGGPSWRYDGAEHITIHGTEIGDEIRSGDGDDALWGHGADDQLEGGIGNDTIHGGQGNDRLSDLFGDDVIHGGGGDDAINSGPGLDIIFGQSGSDYLMHGQEVTQSFAGQGPDLLRGGDAGDIMTGNEADDWMEGGIGADLVQGDNALTFQNDPVGGDDILYGGSGNDDHDAEGGNDIMLNNGRDRHAGMLGFDWVTHKGDPDPVDADLDVLVFQPPNVTLMRSRFMNIEGLSGWDGDDILRGRSEQGDQAFEDGTGHELTPAHMQSVDGLTELLSGGEVGAEIPRFATPFLATSRSNNIILGGAGSDLIEGRGGDDFIDGDAALDVYLVGPDGVAHDRMAAFQEQIFAG